MLVGTIYGEVRQTLFDILLENQGVGKGSYVKVNHETDGWVLARIESMRRFMDDLEEVAVAKARTIGYRREGNIMLPKTPFKPKEKVYSADRKLIVDTLGLKENRSGNIYLGVLDGQDVPIFLDIKKTVSKHVSVLAKTGAGKTYTVGVLLEELLKADVPIVIIDPHDEYSTLKRENNDSEMSKYGVTPRSYERQITSYTVGFESPGSRQLVLNPKFDLYELIDIMPIRLNDRQKAVIYNSLQRIGHENYTLDELIEEVKADSDKAKWKVISGLETLRDSGIFDGRPVSKHELVRPGHASIINLKNTDPHIQQLVVAKIARELFEAKKRDELPNFLFLIEEAHNFCPERSFGDAISSGILRTIASEGRKFGFNLCIVTQRPARIDKSVLSQCNTQIILKVTNPNDLRAIGQSIEGFTPDMEEDIKQLPTGHALVVGGCVEQPITVEVRIRETLHGGSIKAGKEPLKKPPKRGSVRISFSKRLKIAIKKIFLK